MWPKHMQFAITEPLGFVLGVQGSGVQLRQQLHEVSLRERAAAQARVAGRNKFAIPLPFHPLANQPHRPLACPATHGAWHSVLRCSAHSADSRTSMSETVIRAFCLLFSHLKNVCSAIHSVLACPRLSIADLGTGDLRGRWHRPPSSLGAKCQPGLAHSFRMVSPSRTASHCRTFSSSSRSAGHPPCMGRSSRLGAPLRRMARSSRLAGSRTGDSRMWARHTACSQLEDRTCSRGVRRSATHKPTQFRSACDCSSARVQMPCMTF